MENVEEDLEQSNRAEVVACIHMTSIYTCVCPPLRLCTVCALDDLAKSATMYL